MIMVIRAVIRPCVPFARGLMVGLLFSPVLSLCIAHTVQSAPGDLDRTFDNDGKAVADLGEGPTAVAIQPDGKIVVVGNILPAVGPRDFALVRFNRNGKLDNTFGNNGKVITNFGKGNGVGSSGATSYDAATAVAIQKDGKIVVAGYSNVDNNDFFDFDFAIARYKPDGTLDKTFGGDGKITTDFKNGSNDKAFAIAIQKNGKIVLAGVSPNTPGFGDFTLARYNPNGTLDKTFNGNGKVITDFGSVEEARAVAIQTDGKIVAAGPTTATHRSIDFGLARYNPNGTLDRTFGHNGRVVTDFENDSGDEAYSMALQSNGKIVVVGLFTPNGAAFDFAVARYTTRGKLDKTFSGDGKVITDFANSTDTARGVAIQPNGKIIVAGDSLGHSGTDDFALVRYNINGTVDATFGKKGKVLTDFKSKFGSSQSDQAYAVAIQKDCKIVAAGISSSDSSGFAVARYQNSSCGKLDVTPADTSGNDVINGTDTCNEGGSADPSWSANGGG